MHECSVSHCSQLSATKKPGGLCRAHYQQKYRGKDPELFIIPTTPIFFCVQTGCDRAVTEHSLCAVHAKRVKYGLDPAPEGSDAVPNPPCSVEGCGHPVSSIRSGLCHTHNLMLANKGELKPRQMNNKGKTCQWSEGCAEPARAKGFCEQHYWLRKRLDMPHPPKPRCIFEGCENPKGHTTDYCGDHHRQMKATSMVWPLGTPKPRVERVPVLCAVYHCTNYATPERTVCKPHKLRAHSHGLTTEQLIELFDEAKCRVCGAEERLVVDHDHSCCNFPKGGSCGNCIRGVLCNNCNTALGLLGEDESRIHSLLAYMHSLPPVLASAA